MKNIKQLNDMAKKIAQAQNETLEGLNDYEKSIVIETAAAMMKKPRREDIEVEILKNLGTSIFN